MALNIMEREGERKVLELVIEEVLKLMVDTIGLTGDQVEEEMVEDEVEDVVEDVKSWKITNVRSLASIVVKDELNEEDRNGDAYNCGDLDVSVKLEPEYAEKIKGRKQAIGRRYLCEFCLYGTDHEQHFTNHLKTHTGGKHHVCGVCNRAFTHHCKLSVHMSNVHYKITPHECGMSARGFAKPCNLRRHKTSHAKEESNMSKICGVCGKEFTRRFNLRRHKKTHAKDQPYMCKTCGVCGKTFTRRSNLKRHTKTHGNDKPYIQDVHSIHFPQAQMNLAHKSRKRDKCKMSVKGVSPKHRHNRHLKTSKGEKCHVCDVCGRSFLQDYHLRTHRRTHAVDSSFYTKIKPFVCNVCEARFSRSWNLKRHARRHHAETIKVHVIHNTCGVCGLRFNRADQLATHLVTHTGGRINCKIQGHVCDICDLVFNRAGNLKRHIELLHVKSTHYCAECGCKHS